jgi:hypothetical protein
MRVKRCHQKYFRVVASSPPGAQYEYARMNRESRKKKLVDR